MARSMQQWFDAYGESHQNPTNKAIHWICVPVIYFCVVGFLYSIPLPEQSPLVRPHMLASLAVGLVGIFYLRLSLTVAFGMVLWSLFCLGACRYLYTHVDTPLWLICTILFVVAWIGQFYGHKVEGRKPSFLEDLQFLMIGPAWLLGFIYRRLGIPY
ncbi:MAG: DUF962 domain-containing protein [Flavobacteriales bacterium]|nr:MAG: DUF962 domain-containing protein [Flavobacteriales bacterium]